MKKIKFIPNSDCLNLTKVFEYENYHSTGTTKDGEFWVKMGGKTHYFRPEQYTKQCIG